MRVSAFSADETLMMTLKCAVKVQSITTLTNCSSISHEHNRKLFTANLHIMKKSRFERDTCIQFNKLHIIKTLVKTYNLIMVSDHRSAIDKYLTKLKNV